ISHSNKENMGRMKFPGPCLYHYGEGRPVDLRQALDLYRKVQSSGTRDVSQEIRETEDLL
ncbi:SEL1-like repeat protein, partial [Escherichia coli]